MELVQTEMYSYVPKGIPMVGIDEGRNFGETEAWKEDITLIANMDPPNSRVLIATFDFGDSPTVIELTKEGVSVEVDLGELERNCTIRAIKQYGEYIVLFMGNGGSVVVIENQKTVYKSPKKFGGNSEDNAHMLGSDVYYLRDNNRIVSFNIESAVANDSSPLKVVTKDPIVKFVLLGTQTNPLLYTLTDKGLVTGNGTQLVLSDNGKVSNFSLLQNVAGRLIVAGKHKVTGDRHYFSVAKNMSGFVSCTVRSDADSLVPSQLLSWQKSTTTFALVSCQRFWADLLALKAKPVHIWSRRLAQSDEIVMSMRWLNKGTQFLVGGTNRLLMAFTVI